MLNHVYLHFLHEVANDDFFRYESDDVLLAPMRIESILEYTGPLYEFTPTHHAILTDVHFCMVVCCLNLILNSSFFIVHYFQLVFLLCCQNSMPFCISFPICMFVQIDKIISLMKFFFIIDKILEYLLLYHYKIKYWSIV